MTHRKNDMSLLPHERLDAYRVAVALRRAVVDLFGVADHALRDQARRASRSVMLNIAEGCESETPGRRRQHYRYAKASAGESFAVLDGLSLTGVQDLDHGIQLTRRLGAMLRRMTR